MRKKLTLAIELLSVVLFLGLGVKPALAVDMSLKPQAWGISSSQECENTSSAIFSTVFHKNCETAIVEGIAVENLPNKMAPTPTPTPTSDSLLQSIPSAGSSAQFSIGSGTLNGDVIFSMVNSYRNQAGLPSFKQDENLCQLASSRAVEILGELWQGTLHRGLYNRNLSYWITENAIFMPTETSAVNWWLHSSIHRAAIYSSHVYSCVKCMGDACSELFTDYQPK